MTDQYVVRDRATEAAREKEKDRKRKAAERRKKGKDARTNYLDIDGVEYSTMRQGDWFRQPRDENLTNDNFWTVDQLYVYKDVYEHMRPLDLKFLKKKESFAEAVAVTQKLGLHHLMGLQCHYDEYYAKQFFSTLVIKGDNSLSMKWMTSDTYCESDFLTFGEVL